MKKYIGTKLIEAEAMTLGDFVQKRVETPMARVLITMKKPSKVITFVTKMDMKAGHQKMCLKEHTKWPKLLLIVCVLNTMN